VVINANGGDRRRLTINATYDGEPDFSPDGTRIAFDATPGSDRNIYVMSASGTNVQQITDASGDKRHPDWSPDGQRIVYEAGDEDTAEIYVVNADGSGNTPLTDDSDGDRAPTFSPDGTMIAFMTNQRGKWEIAVMDYPSGELIRIFDCPAPDCRFPTWAADGTYIAFNTLDGSGNVAEIWEVSVATGVSSELVAGTGNGRPCYAGDAQYLYYNNATGGNSDLYRINLLTLQTVRLTTGSANEYAPDWGP
jgi:TolB protein